MRGARELLAVAVFLAAIAASACATVKQAAGDDGPVLRIDPRPRTRSPGTFDPRAGEVPLRTLAVLAPTWSEERSTPDAKVEKDPATASRALAELLISRLKEGGRLEPLPLAAVELAVRDLGVPPAASLDPSRAAELGARLGVDAVLLWEVRRYRILSRSASARSGKGTVTHTSTFGEIAFALRLIRSGTGEVIYLVDEAGAYDNFLEEPYIIGGSGARPAKTPKTGRNYTDNRHYLFDLLCAEWLAELAGRVPIGGGVSVPAAPPVPAVAPPPPAAAAPLPAAAPAPTPAADLSGLPPGRTYALVVGIDDYEDDALPDLPQAAAEARAVAERLGGGESVRGLYGREATRARALRAVREHFTQPSVRPEDVAILVFSGHGLSDEAGARFWAAADTRLLELEETSITRAQLEEALSRVVARRIIVIAAGSRLAALGARRGASDLELRPPAGAALAVLAAALPGGAASVDPASGRTVFLTSVLDGLGGGLVSYGRRKVTLAELGAFVLREVPARAARVGGGEAPLVRIPEGMGEVVLAP